METKFGEEPIKMAMSTHHWVHLTHLALCNLAHSLFMQCSYDGLLVTALRKQMLMTKLLSSYTHTSYLGKVGKNALLNIYNYDAHCDGQVFFQTCCTPLETKKICTGLLYIPSLC